MLKENLLSIYANSFQENWDLPALTDYTTKDTMTYGDFARTIARYHLFFKHKQIIAFFCDFVHIFLIFIFLI